MLSILSGAVTALPYEDTSASVAPKLKENQDINALCREKIRSCQMLESERVGGKAVLLVLQLVDRIYCLSLNKHRVFDSRERNPGQNMLKFLMQRGPDQEIYYIESNKDSQS
jgi:hypothetical protein